MTSMRSDLPSGTVTFLFTDVEGSTRLLHELGEEDYAEALAEHRLLLRETFVRHGGVEVDTQGDAFFYAFSSAEGALQAAAEGQEVLDGGPIRVRLGLHTGTPLVTDEGYVGHDVHFAARVAACGPRRSDPALQGDGLARGQGAPHLARLPSPEGRLRAGDDLPAGRAGLPSPEDNRQLEPAHASVQLSGQRAGAVRGRPNS